MEGKFLLNFTAIDFETATRYKNSACSVAVVDIEDGKIVDKYYTLIRPPRMEFDSCNIMIHHITPDMVEDAEDFCRWCLTDFRYTGVLPGGETVMLAPAAGFYATPGLGRNEVRIAYVLNKEDLGRALDVLARALEEYRSR